MNNLHLNSSGQLVQGKTLTEQILPFLQTSASGTLAVPVLQRPLPLGQTVQTAGQAAALPGYTAAGGGAQALPTVTTLSSPAQAPQSYTGYTGALQGLQTGPAVQTAGAALAARQQSGFVNTAAGQLTGQLHQQSLENQQQAALARMQAEAEKAREERIQEEIDNLPTVPTLGEWLKNSGQSHLILENYATPEHIVEKLGVAYKTPEAELAAIQQEIATREEKPEEKRDKKDTQILNELAARVNEIASYRQNLQEFEVQKENYKKYLTNWLTQNYYFLDESQIATAVQDYSNVSVKAEDTFTLPEDLATMEENFDEGQLKLLKIAQLEMEDEWQKIEEFSGYVTAGDPSLTRETALTAEDDIFDYLYRTSDKVTALYHNNSAFKTSQEERENLRRYVSEQEQELLRQLVEGGREDVARMFLGQLQVGLQARITAHNVATRSEEADEYAAKLAEEDAAEKAQEQATRESLQRILAVGPQELSFEEKQRANYALAMRDVSVTNNGYQDYTWEELTALDAVLVNKEILYGEITEQQEKIIEYLLGTNQLKEAQMYVEDLEEEAYNANAEREKQILEDEESSWAEKTGVRIGAGARSVGENFFGTPEYFVALIENAYNNSITLEDTALPPTEEMRRSIESKELAVEGLTGVGKFTAELAISMATNLINTTVGTLIGGPVGTVVGKALGTVATGVMAGAQAAASRAADMYEQGATGSQQLWGSLGSGAAEALGEAISFGKLTTYLDSAFKATGGKALVKEFLLRTGGQLLTEGVEEMATEGMNILLDVSIMKEKSQLSKFYADYLWKNPNPMGLVNAAITLEILKQIGIAGLMGAVSGGIMGAGANGISLAFGGNQNANTNNPGGTNSQNANENATPAAEGANNPAASGQTTAQETLDAVVEQQQTKSDDTGAEGRNIVEHLKAVLSKIPKPGARQNATPAAATTGNAPAVQTQNMAQVQPAQVQSGQPLAQESAQAGPAAAQQQASKKAIPFLKKGETAAKAQQNLMAGAALQTENAQATGAQQGGIARQTAQNVQAEAANQTVQAAGVQQQSGAVQQARQAAQNMQINAGGQTLQTQQSTVAQQAAQVAQQQTGQNQQTRQTTQNAQAEAATQTGQAAQTARAQQVENNILMAMVTNQLQGGETPVRTPGLANYIFAKAKNSPLLGQGANARGRLVAQIAQQWLAQNGTNFDSLSLARQNAFAAQLRTIQKTLPTTQGGTAAQNGYSAAASQNGKFENSANEQNLNSESEVARSQRNDIIEPDAWDGDLSPNKLYERNVNRQEWRTHFQTVEGFNAGKGIIGGHTFQSIAQYFNSLGRGYRIVEKTPHPFVKGLYNIAFQVQAMNPGGEFIEDVYKKPKYRKTVVDTEFLNLESFFWWAETAMENINAEIQNNGRIKLTGQVDVDGKGTVLRFEGWLNPETRMLESWYPIIGKERDGNG